MIPASVYDLPTLAQVATSELESVYRCGCGREAPPEGFVDMTTVGDLSEPRFRCHACASGPHRTALAVQTADEIAALPAWETEAATAVKIKRDHMINTTLWTTAEGSPLTPACRQAWCDWRAAMHRITLDFPSPADVVWPTEPALEYL